MYELSLRIGGLSDEEVSRFDFSNPYYICYFY